METELARDGAILRLTDREWSVIVTALNYAEVDEERGLERWGRLAEAEPDNDRYADRVRDHSGVLAEIRAVRRKLEDAGV